MRSFVVKALVCGLVVSMGSRPAWDSYAQDVPSALRWADAIRLAEENNPVYLAAQREHSIAQAAVIQARVYPNPQFSLNAEQLEAFGRHEHEHHPEWFAHFVQEVESVSKRRHRNAAAHAGLAGTLAGIQDVRRALHLAVGQAYFALARHESGARILQTFHDRIQELVALVAQQVEQGETAAMELQRLQLEQIRLQDRMLQADLTLARAQAALLSMLGARDVRQSVHAADSLTVASLVDARGTVIAAADGFMLPLEVLQDMALRHRPDLVAATHAVEKARAKVALQRALRIPNLAITAGYRRDYDAGLLDVGIALGLPLWSSLDGGGLAYADAVRSRAAADLHAARMKVKTEVAQAAAGVSSAAERVRLIAQQYLAQVAELQDRIQTAYTLGESSLTVLIDLQRSHLEALQLRNDAVVDFRISQLVLANALGIAPQFQNP